jgi:hypothetical protein
VLIVEDEESLADPLAYLLRKEGFEATVVGDGTSALTEFDRSGADNVLLRGDDLAARFPWLVTDGIAAACFGLSGEGWVDPYMFAALFRKSAIAKGVEMIQDEVTGVSRAGDRITGGALASGETIACGTAQEVKSDQKVIEAYLGVESKELQA